LGIRFPHDMVALNHVCSRAGYIAAILRIFNADNS
jgi:hypothetical protein